MSNAWAETLRYWRALPNGLSSFPQCRAHVETTRTMLEEFPSLINQPGLPPEVVNALKTLPADGFVPDALGVCARLMAYDSVFKNEVDFLAWHYTLSARVFNKPLYRALMYIMSPTLLVTNSAKRWSAFRTGTTLESVVQKGSKGAVTLILRHPAGLYPLMMLHGFAESFRAAVTAAGAKQATCQVIERVGQGTTYELRWQ